MNEYIEELIDKYQDILDCLPEDKTEWEDVEWAEFNLVTEVLEDLNGLT